MKPLHVVTITSELVPLAKTGGLGDVCGALPVALEQLGCVCSSFLPAYRCSLRSGLSIESTGVAFTVEVGGEHIACRILRTKLPGSHSWIYLVDQPSLFDREGIYADRAGDYRDNCKRFVFFNLAVLEAISQLDLKVDIVQCHDWTTGLTPAYVQTGFGGHDWMRQAKTVMTIHNMAYQGVFWHLDMPLTGLDWQYFNWKQMEYHGQLNFLKTGLVFADAITTVSPTYAVEIQSPEFGCGLHDILQDKSEKVYGVVNGVDYAQWNPATDSFLPRQYGLDDWREGKAACKSHLQAMLGLEVSADRPLIGIVSRLADQKGWDLILPLLQDWLQSAPGEKRDLQWAILGTGDPQIESQLAALSERYPGKLSARLEFSESVAHLIEAGSDIFLMPSRYEPCGLNQLYSLKYGAVPVVHATGGLYDTVCDAKDASADGTGATGFCFTEYARPSLEACLERAVDCYLHSGHAWEQIVQSGMRKDWSWQQSAEQYREIFWKTVRTP